jgi:hypothetical protein
MLCMPQQYVRQLAFRAQWLYIGIHAVATAEGRPGLIAWEDTEAPSPCQCRRRYANWEKCLDVYT